MRGDAVIDWTKEMRQTFEFYEVDPRTWQNVRLLPQVVSAEITCDDELPTGGSATFEASEDVGEVYVRTYLVAEQGGERSAECLGTHMAQTCSDDHDGKSRLLKLEAYTSLIELKGDCPPLGHHVSAGRLAGDAAAQAAAEHCRAPVDGSPGAVALAVHYRCEPDQTWLDLVAALAAKEGRRPYPTPLGRITFIPGRNAAALVPVWKFTDDTASIVRPEISHARDYYGVPNRVEVVWSGEAGCLSAIAENHSPDSPLSIENRGWVWLYRETSPDLEDPTQEDVQAYADSLLTDLSTVDHEVTYTHGYVPAVKVGTCVELDLRRAKVRARAVVASQRIVCGTGCQVEERAVWTEVML